MRNGLALVLALLMFVYASINAAALQESSMECWFVFSLMASSALALSLLTLRPATSIALVSALVMALQYAAVAKFEQLHDPLLITDLLYFSSFGIFDTLSHYPDIVLIVKYVVPALLVVFGLLLYADIRLWKSRRKPVRRVLQLSGFVLASILVVTIDSARGPFASVVDKSLWSSLSDASHLANFFVSIPNSGIELPTFPGAPGAADSWPMAAADSRMPERKPDIFMVLEESTFDPRTLTMCAIDECRLPGFF